MAKQRGNDSSLALTVLEEVSRIVVSVDLSLYESYEKLARERIQRRDPDDWPVVAVALMLGVPVWTEDQDFFGSAAFQLGLRIVWSYISEALRSCHATVTRSVVKRGKLRTKVK